MGSSEVVIFTNNVPIPPTRRNENSSHVRPSVKLLQYIYLITLFLKVYTHQLISCIFSCFGLLKPSFSSVLKPPKRICLKTTQSILVSIAFCIRSKHLPSVKNCPSTPSMDSPLSIAASTISRSPTAAACKIVTLLIDSSTPEESLHSDRVCILIRLEFDNSAKECHHRQHDDEANIYLQ